MSPVRLGQDWLYGTQKPDCKNPRENLTLSPPQTGFLRHLVLGRKKITREKKKNCSQKGVSACGNEVMTGFSVPAEDQSGKPEMVNATKGKKL